MRHFILAILAVMTLTMTAQSSVQSARFHTNNKKAIELLQQATSYGVDRHTKLVLLQKALQKDDKFVEVYWEASRTWNSLDSTEKALAVLRSADTDGMPERTTTEIMIAELLMMTGRFDEAITTLKSIPGNEFMQHRTSLEKRCQTSLDLINNPVDFHPVNLEAVNTEMDDYFPSITADGKIFSTTVSDRNLNRQGQEDLYWSVNVDGKWQKSRPLNDLNTIGNEGSQSFSADGRYMFFVACDRKESDGGCDIYYSIRMGERWSLPINPGAPLNTTNWESNPVLSPAGNELFYVTNRDGQSDIWHCDVVIGEGGRLTFKNPRPLGSPVNTKKDEYAPFIHADNKTLYFASKGHPGLGQNDIFYSRRENGQWSKPKNIGYPINTSGDEMSFVVTAAGDKAYFASNKIEGGSRGYDIYEIDLPTPAKPQSMHCVYGKIIDAESHKPLSAFIEIFDTDGKTKIFESVSDKSDGSFTAFLPTEGIKGIDARKKGYLFYTDHINASTDSIIIALHPAIEGNSIVLNNLYFATNSAVIESRSYSDIQHLYEFLTQNAGVTIHIVGHTDNTGTNAINNQLSLDRANALKEALVRKGIKEERITTDGKGSSEPIDTNDTEEGRAKNRRVEIRINSNKAPMR